ncbi:ATP-binding protein [Pseudobutyrivibrio sp.]|uniref:ATP-binding protein n=1 Tax=Pseudobutyrivibrio sp. TaxID=2014367 RepID=UPI001DE43A1A|nr:ATP-binding protein [Pseudobutyrivibrio sp.]MBE5909575.1 ATP-binding protein [Pseudobutyrivibrio sp.]
MDKLIVESTKDNLNKVLSFIDAKLEAIQCPMKAQMKIDVAVEEIFINIASYAYGNEVGNAEIILDINDSNTKATITFVDEGIPYNPLEKDDPDTTLSADERQIGGLGIFIVKKSMDSVEYKNQEGKNILTISYCWS